MLGAAAARGRCRFCTDTATRQGDTQASSALPHRALKMVKQVRISVRFLRGVHILCLSGNAVGICAPHVEFEVELPGANRVRSLALGIKEGDAKLDELEEVDVHPRLLRTTTTTTTKRPPG